MNVYQKDTHNISLDDIDKDALYILEKLKVKGFSAYLVGGGVRDLLLGKKPKDFDISTSAKPEEIKKLFRNCILIGRRFRLAHIRFGKKIIEVSTFRSGSTENDELITRDNDFGTEEEDALRRDFTINGLLYDSEKQTVIDYVGGYPDIEKKLLRMIGQPYVRFKQDPVRMLRCVKFKARFGFEVEKETFQALIDSKGEILKSSQARILEEILRMLEIGSSYNFFKLMTSTGLLELLMPALSHFLESKDGERIFSFLKEVDLFHLENIYTLLPRSVLLTCLIFPHLQRTLLELVNPHYGRIQLEANKVIDNFFYPFFNIPRRTRGQIVDILISQYRITPLTKRKERSIRIPRIPDFKDALTFFNLRARLEPGLKEILEKWQIAFEKAPPIKRRPYIRRRRK